MKSMNEEQFQAILGLYSKKGYQIIKDPDVKKEIPPFLSSSDYKPDYIIRSESMNYIVGLSSSKNINNEDKLKKIIEEVEKNISWEFILVVADTPPKVDKPIPEVTLKADEPRRHKKSEKDSPAPAVIQKEDKPAPVIEQKDEKQAPVSEPEDEQTAVGFEAEGDDSEEDFETEFEMSEIDMDSEDTKPRSAEKPAKEKLPEESDPITKGYQGLKLMLENKQSELYREPVLLYGWTLLETMLRKLIDKERTGTDIWFLLNEAVSYNIIDNSEVTALKDVYLLRNKLVRGEFGIVTEKLPLESLIKAVNKLYDKHFV